ncbi:MAG: hypothetical protein V1696_03910 [Candidatus Jorgensenbacteria bacterium]
MKNWLKENWFKIGLLAILVISVVGAFYWWEIRPAQIRKSCFNSAIKSLLRIYNTESERRSELNFIYQNCLRLSGLEK